MVMWVDTWMSISIHMILSVFGFHSMKRINYE